MKNDRRAHRTYTSPEIAAWIRRYHASGVGRPAFAQPHGLLPGRWPDWVYQRAPAPPRPSKQLPTLVQELNLAPGLPLSSWAAEIRRSAGPGVRLGAPTTPVWRSAVIQALRRPC